MYERLPTFCYNCGLISYGNKSCTRSSSSETGGFSLPSHDKRLPIERTTHVSHDVNHCMDISDPIFVLGTEDNPETDFGPWLLISRRRSRARGYGCGVGCANHMTSRTAAGLDAKVTESWGTTSHSLRGGSRFLGRGRSSTIHAPHKSPRSDAVAVPLVQSPIANLVVNQNIEIISTHIENNPIDPIPFPSDSLNPKVSNLNDSLFLIIPFSGPRVDPQLILSTQISPFRNPRGATQMNNFSRPISPPPSCEHIFQMSPSTPFLLDICIVPL